MARHSYPHQDHSLTTIKGERWKDIPGLEGYFHISNMGRVKRLEYELVYEDGRRFVKRSMIIKPHITRQHLVNARDNQFLMNRVTLDGIKYGLTIARLVYYCFKAPFDLSDQHIVIICKDGDGLNVRPANLVKSDLSSRSKRSFARGRGYTPLGDSTAPWAKRQRQAIVETNSKQVSQYNLKGKRMHTYSSCAAAQAATGIFAQSIGKVASAPGYKAGDYYWAWGKEKKIEIASLLKERLLLNRERNGQKLTQYDQAGNKIASYPSIKDASEAIGSYGTALRMAIRGKYKSVNGFIWRAGYGKDKIDLSNYVWGRASSAQSNSIPVQQLALNGKLLKQYGSIKEASAAVNISKNGISNVCKGSQYTAAGFRWKYAAIKNK